MLVLVRKDETAAAVVVGRMAAVEVAVEAQVGQSLADIVNSHSPLWVQTPVSRRLSVRKNTIKRCKEKTEKFNCVAPRGVFPGMLLYFEWGMEDERIWKST